MYIQQPDVSIRMEYMYSVVLSTWLYVEFQFHWHVEVLLGEVSAL